MKKLVIDIETVGILWEEHDPYVREYLIKGLSDGDAEEAKRSGGLSPFRGRIIAIGVINIDDGRSCALYEVPGQQDVRVEKAGLRTYISGTEKQILEKFWDWFESDSRFITFNGRQFDGPFLMIRSAIHGLTPKRDLVGIRYELHPNCDLREVLNFFGTPNPRQYKFNLDLACKAFGVETSKGEGLDGRSVETWYRAGRHREIAEYCMDDVRATAELYEKLAATLLPMNARFRDVELRAARNAGQMPLIPTIEPTFMQQITQTSLTLTEALEQEPPVVMGAHEAIVLEKLIKSEEQEEVPTTELP
ncbi:MAG TPA: ribonuclease H-like domain-containing protein [Thermoanaerobaculia bacterium]|nr:ribonuclease H-like domain-containing protein [Thermoanaerobaculia bacterium]